LQALLNAEGRYTKFASKGLMTTLIALSSAPGSSSARRFLILLPPVRSHSTGAFRPAYETSPPEYRRSVPRND